MTLEAKQLHELFERRASEVGGRTPTLAEVRAALAAKDQNAHLATQLGRISVEVWDGETPVGDGSPDYIRGQYPSADLIYLLRIDGEIVYLQPHEPGVAGFVPVTSETVGIVTEAHATEVATGMADAAIANEIAQSLGLRLG